ncbi:hypothetical protein [Haloarchaeobius baliensis]|uniref:hypothetical protein n=1 Tax=Haloarchaeobius baliensis TaxID=1670458 RepID=UPI003F882602
MNPDTATKAFVAGMGGIVVWYVLVQQSVVPLPDEFVLGLVAFPVFLIAASLTEFSVRSWMRSAVLMYGAFTLAQLVG